jgi:hypothetical protein
MHAIAANTKPGAYDCPTGKQLQTTRGGNIARCNRSESAGNRNAA